NSFSTHLEPIKGEERWLLQTKKLYKFPFIYRVFLYEFQFTVHQILVSKMLIYVKCFKEVYT
uniref:Uncharacterized protein n=1 Tax=Callorhinchus milii TaxID=7868 RepID=A0A4W3GJW8_CALMI